MFTSSTGCNSDCRLLTLKLVSAPTFLRAGGGVRCSVRGAGVVRLATERRACRAPIVAPIVGSNMN